MHTALYLKTLGPDPFSDFLAFAGQLSLSRGMNAGRPQPVTASAGGDIHDRIDPIWSCQEGQTLQTLFLADTCLQYCFRVCRMITTKQLDDKSGGKL